MKQILLNSAYFGAVLSLLGFWIGTVLQKRTKSLLLSPVLVSTGLSIAALLLVGMDYDAYYSSAKYLSYLLTPATVCLAIPLYEQLHLLRKNAAAILIGILSGVLASAGSILLMGWLLTMDWTEIASLLPKSVTLAIGLPLSEQIGGYPSITAISIVITGVMGNALGEGFLKLIRVTHPIARGIALGTSAHAAGTAKAAELGEIDGAMSGLSLAVSGLLTVIVFAFIS